VSAISTAAARRSGHMLVGPRPLASRRVAETQGVRARGGFGQVSLWPTPLGDQSWGYSCLWKHPGDTMYHAVSVTVQPLSDRPTCGTGARPRRWGPEAQLR